MTIRKTAAIFPFLPDYSTWEDWNGNFIMWYGQETIPAESEANWQSAAEQIMQTQTFSAYPVPEPKTFASWQDWALALTSAINGTSH
jgi:hypothetical protein